MAHNEECRMRIKRCLDDEAQAKREAIKKQKEDDERVGERA